MQDTCPNKSFDVLYSQKRRMLVKLASSIVGCPSLAEDIVQEAFLHFASTVSSTEIESQTAYLRVIVRNEAIRIARKSIRELQAHERYLTNSFANSCQQIDVNPELTSIRRSQYQAFNRNLEALPLPMRDAVRMYLVEELTLRKISERLEVSLGKAHSLVIDGIAKCQEKI